jgi:hypothetical protein
MSAPTPSRTLWRLAIAVWAAAAAAGAATVLLRSQRPAAMPSISCAIDRTGTTRWFLSRTGDTASVEGPSPAELKRVDAVALEIPVEAPAAALVIALHACARAEPLAVAIAAPDATSAAPAFLAIPPRAPDPLALDAEPVVIATVDGTLWSIGTLGVAERVPALGVGDALARLRGPGRAISAMQPIEIRCGAHDFAGVRDVLVGVLKSAPESRIVIVGGRIP